MCRQVTANGHITSHHFQTCWNMVNIETCGPRGQLHSVCFELGHKPGKPIVCQSFENLAVSVLKKHMLLWCIVKVAKTGSFEKCKEAAWNVPATENYFLPLSGELCPWLGQWKTAGHDATVGKKSLMSNMVLLNPNMDVDPSTDYGL